jgi:hypothetical protein
VRWKNYSLACTNEIPVSAENFLVLHLGNFVRVIGITEDDGGVNLSGSGSVELLSGIVNELTSLTVGKLLEIDSDNLIVKSLPVANHGDVGVGAALDC